jgi:hypothetical protein
MEFNFYTNYGAFVRPDYYPEYDFDFDPTLYDFGVNYFDQVAAIWVGNIPTQFAFIRLDGEVNLTAGHTLGEIGIFTHNVALSQFNGNVNALGSVTSNNGAHVLSAKKNFDIPHPSKEGWRLRHTCLEGPQNDVYIRGRLKNKTDIELPRYWKDLVDISSITVNITPIGMDQGISVKRIEKDKVVLQSKGNLPIDCFYTVYAERKDGEKLIPEYEGSSPADYPGNNDEYSVSGFHYDKKK